jgi:hypothetical protein
VALVELGGGGIRIEALFVPVFRELVPVKGDMAAVRAHLERLKERGSDAIVEVAVVGSPLDASVRDEVDAVVKGSRLEVTAVRNLSREAEIMDRSETAGVLLRDMDERQVFGRLLDEFAERIGPGERDGLLAAYEEILRTLDDEEEEGLAAKPAAAAPQSKGRPGGAPAGSGTAAAPEPEGPGTGGAEPEAAGTGGAGPEDAWPEGSPPDGSVPGGSAQEGPGEGAGGADAALGQPPRERGEGR